MPALPLVYAPNPIFKQKASPVERVDDTIRQLIDNMFGTLYLEKGIGLGANMVGVLKRIIVLDMQEDGKRTPISFINPDIIARSEETQTFKEASLCFPGISAEITRPKDITVRYLDYQGNEQVLKASGFFATVIQHEVDYLDGKVFLDYLSKMKREMLLKKMEKHLKHA